VNKYIVLTGVRKLDCVAHNLVTVLTTLSRPCRTEGDAWWRGGEAVMVAHTDCW